MRRGDLFRVYRHSKLDPKKYRVFVVVSRQVLVDSRFSTVICAPIYSSYDGLDTQVQLGIEEGMKRTCSIHCDELVSIPKSSLTDFIASLPSDKIMQLNEARKMALEL